MGSGTPLYVHGSDAVSIGTIDTANKLDVEGSIAIGTTYAGAQAAPTNGAIIEGNVGIGTDTPQSSLDVEGAVAIGSTYSGATVAPTDGAIIQGKVGIGEINPNGFTQLAVAGGVAVGSYSPNASPENGLIVSGKVGIGTNSPSQALELVETTPVLLVKGTAGSSSIDLDTNDETNVSQINFKLSGSQEGSVIYDHASPTDEKLTINVGNQNFYFQGNGRLGIGESIPDALLEISDAATANLFGWRN